MKKVGIRFKKTGRLSFYLTDIDDIKLSDNVVADTEKGEELGVVAKILEPLENESLESINCWIYFRWYKTNNILCIRR